MKDKPIIVLKKTQDFKRVMNRRELNVSNPVFRLHYLNNKLKKLRFGLAVNKKNFKTAVLRNKIKRQMREIIRHIDSPKHIDMVVIVKYAYINNTFQANKKMFTTLYNTIPI
jgi:ribonuclease P protein component